MHDGQIARCIICGGQSRQNIQLQQNTDNENK